MWVPIHRLKEEAVFSGLVMSCSRATAPTVRLPFSSRHTTLGVSSSPREFFTSSGLPSLQTQARELVVPRSMPRIAIISYLLSIGFAGGPGPISRAGGKE